MSLSPKQRFVLINHVNALVPPDFETLVFSLKAPRRVIPSRSAAQGNRSSALLEWVEGPSGCGMPMLLNMLSNIGPLPPQLKNIEIDERTYQDGTLAQQVDEWFQSLNYSRESYERVEAEYSEWIISVQVWRGYKRILVRCIVGEAGIIQLQGLHQAAESQKTDEGWLISNRRISSAVKKTLEESEYSEYDLH